MHNCLRTPFHQKKIVALVIRIGWQNALKYTGWRGHPDVPFIRAPKMNLGCRQKIWCKSVLGDIFWVWTA